MFTNSNSKARPRIFMVLSASSRRSVAQISGLTILHAKSAPSYYGKPDTGTKLSKTADHRSPAVLPHLAAFSGSWKGLGSGNEASLASSLSIGCFTSLLNTRSVDEAAPPVSPLPSFCIRQLQLINDSNLREEGLRDSLKASHSCW